MNPFKARRREFIRRYFPFPHALETAIRASEPGALEIHLIGPNALEQLRRFDRPEEIFRILDRQGFCRHYNWSYSFDEDTRIYDWCCLRWIRTVGLWVHFEFLQVYRPDFPLDKQEMDQASWDFFFARRKTILAHFLGGRLVGHAREEDFTSLLVDLREG